MKITEDKSYINESAINKGWKSLDIHGIRIDRFFTEEEMAQNREKRRTAQANSGQTIAKT